MNRMVLPSVAGGAVLAGLAALALVPRNTATGPAPIGGPFTLTDGGGHRVTEHDFSGKWRLVYFGYTHCPDACPATLSALGAALDTLTPAARARLRVLFITVDPARDTPGVVGAYAQAFGPEFTGLTGSQADLAPVEASYHVYVARHTLKGGDYAMDHSNIIYVMKPDGTFAGLLDDGMSPAEMARRLQGFGA